MPLDLDMLSDEMCPHKIIQPNDLVKSVVYSDLEAIVNTQVLHEFDGIDLDATYSKGLFYGGLIHPKIRSDLSVQSDNNNLCMDSTLIPLKNNSINSIVFDPPFMFGTHGQTKNNIMNKRFTMFDSFGELEFMYKHSLAEFYRILRRGGILMFKCQDYTDSKTTATHCLIHNWALDIGFKLEDLFILLYGKGRIYNPYLRQKHSRKFHCYWWVFRK